MSHELPLPPWVPFGLVPQTFLQKDILKRVLYELPPNTTLAPEFQENNPVYVVPTSTWVPPQG